MSDYDLQNLAFLDFLKGQEQGRTGEKMKELLDDALDSDGEVSIGNLTYDKSAVLKAVDPVAYRCAFSDFTDEYIEIHHGDGEFLYYEDADVADAWNLYQEEKAIP